MKYLEKLITAFLLLLVIAFKANAQEYIPFPTDSAAWNITTYTYGDCNPNFGDKCDYTNRFKVNGDTIIKGIKYAKLYVDGTLNNNDIQYIGGFREDSTKKVFYLGSLYYHSFWCGDMEYYDTTEVLLYDFGLNIDDSIKNINFNCAKALVIDIDSIEYAGKLRKRFTIAREGYEHWIEGVGSTKGLFYPLLNWFEEDWELTCFEENISDWTTSECLTVGIEDNNVPVNILDIYPNPMRNNAILAFENESGLEHNIEIYNILGKLIYSTQTCEESITLNKADLYSGTFVFIVKTEEEIVGKGKFMVE